MNDTEKTTIIVEQFKKAKDEAMTYIGDEYEHMLIRTRLTLLQSKSIELAKMERNCFSSIFDSMRCKMLDHFVRYCKEALGEEYDNTRKRVMFYLEIFDEMLISNEKAFFMCFVEMCDDCGMKLKVPKWNNFKEQLFDNMRDELFK